MGAQVFLSTFKPTKGLLLINSRRESLVSWLGMGCDPGHPGGKPGVHSLRHSWNCAWKVGTVICPQTFWAHCVSFLGLCNKSPQTGCFQQQKSFLSSGACESEVKVTADSEGPRGGKFLSLPASSGCWLFLAFITPISASVFTAPSPLCQALPFQISVFFSGPQALGSGSPCSRRTSS